MQSFCNEIIKYFEVYSNEEKIIALTLRDIFLNDLIYISYTNRWQQYDIKEKEWSHFDINKLVKKLDKVSSFFENELIRFVEEESNLEKIDKYHVVKQIRKVIHYMHEKLNTKAFSKKCQEYFKILS
jgi:hypothetical protein|uniref:Uncharacterized protein n=1 Tax=viral metagenome TaxID=1070528 RepID=A0A6C0CV29_9ZZZZ